MVEILRRGRESYGYASVKAEFEAEGTRSDELLRLLEIANRADLPLTLKIGGCEAIRDLFEAKQFGATYIVAPMVETPYALSKFVASKEKAYTSDEMMDTDFLFNMETITAYENREEICKIAGANPGADGIVFGRGDFVKSMDWDGETTNDERVTDMIVDVAALCHKKSIDLVVGGGVSIDSVPALRRIANVHLTRFETRKVVFHSTALKCDEIDKGLLAAVHFELLWLMNKRDYYGAIEREDVKRFETLERRWKVLGSSV
jgi:hypothetical protein